MKNKKAALVPAALLGGLTLALLLPFAWGRLASPGLDLPKLDDLEGIHARLVGPSGAFEPEEFALPRRYDAQVLAYFRDRAWTWGTPTIPDRARVAQLRFRAHGSDTVDVYDAGENRIGVGTSGGRTLLDAPGGARSLLALLEKARKREGIPEVAEIRLDRSPCKGTCPHDSVTFRADGTATFEGFSNADRKGKFAGSIAAADFRELARLVDDNNFAAMNATYDRHVTDVATLTTTVRWASTVKKTEDHGHAGPDPLREIEEAIVDQARRVDWKPAP